MTSVPVSPLSSSARGDKDGDDKSVKEGASISGDYKDRGREKDREEAPRRGEDWKMGVMWGRTLVGLASELVRHASSAAAADELGLQPATPNPMEEYARLEAEPPQPTLPAFLLLRSRSLSRSRSSSSTITTASSSSAATIKESQSDKISRLFSHPQSLFTLVSKRRPPVTRRMSFSATSNQKNGEGVEEIMDLAMDQLSSGVFHMPRDAVHVPPAPHHHHQQQQDPSLSRTPATRTKVLLVIAEAILSLCALFPTAQEGSDNRYYWAQQKKKHALWTSSLLDQASAPPKGRAGFMGMLSVGLHGRAGTRPLVGGPLAGVGIGVGVGVGGGAHAHVHGHGHSHSYSHPHSQHPYPSVALSSNAPSLQASSSSSSGARSHGHHTSAPKHTHPREEEDVATTTTAAATATRYSGRGLSMAPTKATKRPRLGREDSNVSTDSTTTAGTDETETEFEIERGHETEIESPETSGSDSTASRSSSSLTPPAHMRSHSHSHSHPHPHSHSHQHTQHAHAPAHHHAHPHPHPHHSPYTLPIALLRGKCYYLLGTAELELGSEGGGGEDAAKDALARGVGFLEVAARMEGLDSDSGSGSMRYHDMAGEDSDHHGSFGEREREREETRTLLVKALRALVPLERNVVRKGELVAMVASLSHPPPTLSPSLLAVADFGSGAGAGGGLHPDPDPDAMDVDVDI
jgi:hypothetical protein